MEQITYDDMTKNQLRLESANRIGIPKSENRLRMIAYLEISDREKENMVNLRRGKVVKRRRFETCPMGNSTNKESFDILNVPINTVRRFILPHLSNKEIGRLAKTCKRFYIFGAEVIYPEFKRLVLQHRRIKDPEGKYKIDIESERSVLGKGRCITPYALLQIIKMGIKNLITRRNSNNNKPTISVKEVILLIKRIHYAGSLENYNYSISIGREANDIINKRQREQVDLLNDLIDTKGFMIYQIKDYDIIKNPITLFMGDDNKSIYSDINLLNCVTLGNIFSRFIFFADPIPYSFWETKSDIETALGPPLRLTHKPMIISIPLLKPDPIDYPFQILVKGPLKRRKLIPRYRCLQCVMLLGPCRIHNY
jgi:hypothetical protein